MVLFSYYQMKVIQLLSDEGQDYFCHLIHWFFYYVGSDSGFTERKKKSFFLSYAWLVKGEALFFPTVQYLCFFEAALMLVVIIQPQINKHFIKYIDLVASNFLFYRFLIRSTSLMFFSGFLWQNYRLDNVPFVFCQQSSNNLSSIQIHFVCPCEANALDCWKYLFLLCWFYYVCTRDSIQSHL